MARKIYVPRAGDIVWLNFDPQSGKEQRGHRPALVISPEDYNRITGLMLCCPMTTQIKGYPFEVNISTAEQNSVVLVDQVKSLDWKSRKVVFKETADKKAFREIQAKLKALLQIK